MREILIMMFLITTSQFQKNVVNLAITEEETPDPEIARKLAQLVCINGNLEKLNDTEPLSSEFDEILAQRLNFTKALDL